MGSGEWRRGEEVSVKSIERDGRNINQTYAIVMYTVYTRYNAYVIGVLYTYCGK